MLIEAGPAGLCFKSRYNNVAVEYRVPGSYAKENLALSLDLLKEVEGSKDDPVQIRQTGNREIEAQWTHSAVPQSKLFSA